MTCEEAREKLGAPGRSSPSDEALLRAHLVGCPECAASGAVMRMLADTSYEPPAMRVSLAGRIKSGLFRRRGAAAWGPLRASLFAGASAAVGALVLGYMLDAIFPRSVAALDTSSDIPELATSDDTWFESTAALPMLSFATDDQGLTLIGPEYSALDEGGRTGAAEPEPQDDEGDPLTGDTMFSSFDQVDDMSADELLKLESLLNAQGHG